MVGKGNFTTKFCYDEAASVFSKFFTDDSRGFTEQIIIVGRKKYSACLGPAPCWGGGTPAHTCHVADLPAFPFGADAFVNYTELPGGTQTVRDFAGTAHDVTAWVGSVHGYSSGGPLPTIQYFDAASPHTIRGNVLIDEPGWVTEIRWFNDATEGVAASCVAVPPSCTRPQP